MFLLTLFSVCKGWLDRNRKFISICW